MKGLFFAMMLLPAIGALSQERMKGIFENHGDIGNPKVKGSLLFNAATEQYDISGGGYNIWFNRDEFHYGWSMAKGDFMITANVELLGEGKEPHRKIGLMIRASGKEDAAHMSAVLHGDGLTVLQWRRTTGAAMRDPQDEIFWKNKSPQILQLERLGKVFIMRAAYVGEPLQEIGRTDSIDMPDEVMAGIFMCSHNADNLEKGRAWNVRLEKTVPDNFNGYKDGILKSKLELLDVFAGTRKVIHKDSGRFEAPNWMPDGKHILFNQGGNIYTIPVEGGKPKQLNTGAAKRNNNDHVISFDGKMLGISSHRDGLAGGGSTVYVLPLTGGEPKLITEATPSYLHSWSPDGKELVYTAQRDAAGPTYNIYKKAVTGGAEVQLTLNKTGLSDGPEYSPDGKFIYYNANHSGRMQLYRMLPDGSKQEQLTSDDYNNWFPHISPDGKWIAFISFPATVDSADHPFYKRVMLRLMPVSGGTPKVIAYLYGGQGTINTPSWSPDSKRLAFVSNTK